MKKPDYNFVEQTFDTEFGQRVNVKREYLGETDSDREVAESMNGVLNGIGQQLAPDHSSYMGTFAVHIYETPALRQLFYVIQNCKGEIPEMVASKAFEDLRGQVMESYGRNRPKKRSGF